MGGPAKIRGAAVRKNLDFLLAASPEPALQFPPQHFPDEVRHACCRSPV